MGNQTKRTPKGAMSIADKSRIKGRLEVVAIKNTRMGLSDRLIEAGKVGYVMHDMLDRGNYGVRCVVFWPYEKKEYKGDWRQGVHLWADLRKTGNRG